MKKSTSFSKIILGFLFLFLSYNIEATPVAPPLVTFNPANASTNIALSTNIVITFDQAIRNIDDSDIATNVDIQALIIFKETNASGLDVTFTGSINAGRTEITLTPSSLLKANQVYYVELVASTVENASDEAVVTAQTSTFTTASAPNLTFSPTNGSTDISLSSTITLTFSEAIRNIDNSALTNTNVDALLQLRETNAAGTPVTFDATINAGKTEITITPSATLKAGQLYYVALNANAVENALNAPISTVQSSTFTTAAAPNLTFNPTGGATNVNPTSSIVLTFNEAIRNIDNSALTNTNVDALLQLRETNAAGTPVTFDATINAGKTEITITPSATLKAGQLYYVALNANAVENALDVPISTVQSSTFTTIAPPNVFFTPSDAATAIPINQTITISFDQAIRNIDNSSIVNGDITSLVELRETNASGTPVAFTGTINPSKTEITITPNSNLNAGQLHYVALNNNVVENSSDAALTLQEITFTTVSGNVTITAPSLTNLCLGQYTSFNITINEGTGAGANGRFIEGSNQTLILSMPTGFELKPSTGLINHSGGNLTASSILVTNNTVSITYTVSGSPTGASDQLQITDLEVQPTTASSVGDLTRSGGTGIILGNNNGTVHASFASAAVPTVTLVSDVTSDIACEDETVTFTAFGATSYTFSVNGGTPQAATTPPNQFAINTLNDGDKVVAIGSNGTCTANSNEVTMTIKDKPLVYLNSNQGNIVCVGDAVEFVAFGPPSTTFEFYIGNTLQTSSGSTFTTSSLTDGDVVTVIGTNNGCTSAASVATATTDAKITMTVTTPPNVTITAPTVTDYTSDDTTPVTLSANVSPTGGVLTVSGPGVSGSAGSEQFTPSVAGEGIHSIVYSYTLGGCTVEATLNVSVERSSSLPVFENFDLSYCATDNTSYELILVPPGDEYKTDSDFRMICSGPGVSVKNPVPAAGPQSALYHFVPSVVGTDATIEIEYEIEKWKEIIIKINNPFGGTIKINTGVFEWKRVTRGREVVTIKDVPVLNLGITDNQRFCKDIGATSLEATVDGSTTFPGGTTTYTISPNPNSYDISGGILDPSSSLLNPGTYTITFEFEEVGGCTESISRTIHIDAIPTVDFIGLGTATSPPTPATTKYCTNNADITLQGVANSVNVTNDDVEFTVGSSDTGPFGPAPFLTNNGDGTATLKPSIMPAGDYYIQMIYQTSGSACIRTVVKGVTIQNIPNVGVILSPTNPGPIKRYCKDVTSVTLAGQANGSPAGAGTFLIGTNSIGPFASGTGLTDNGDGTAALNPSTMTAGDYWIQFSYTDGNSCTNTYIQQVTIYDLPIPSFTFSSDPLTQFCQYSTNITITGSDDGTPTTSGIYRLGTNSTGPFAMNPSLVNPGTPDGTATLNPVGLSPNTYWIEYSYTNANGCTETSVQSFVISNTNIDIANLNTEYCTNNGNQTIEAHVNGSIVTVPSDVSFEFSSTSSTAGFSVDASRVINNGDGTATFIPTGLAAGNYWIKLKYEASSGELCALERVEQVTINPLPNTNFIGMATNYCKEVAAPSFVLQGRDGTTNVTSGTFGIGTSDTGPFSTNANFVDNADGTATFTPANLTAGTYWVQFSYTDGNSCINTEVQQVEIFDLPITNFEGLEAQYCQSGPAITLRGKDDITPVNTGTYRLGISASGPFNINAAVVNNGDGTASVNTSLLPVGNYWIEYTYDNGNCEDNDIQAVEIINNTVDYTGLSTTVPYCVNSPSAIITAQVNGSPSGPTDVILFELFDGFGLVAPGAYLINNGDGTATLSPSFLSPGSYSLKMSYQNSSGTCLLEEIKAFSVEALPNVDFNNLASSYCTIAPILNVNLQGTDGVANLPSGTFMLSNNSSTGPFALDANLVNGAATPGNGQATFTPANLVPGTYWIQYSYTNTDGCTNTEVKEVIIYDLPDANFTGLSPSAEYCQNDPQIALTGRDGTTIVTTGDFKLGTSSTGPFGANPALTSSAGSFNLNPALLAAGDYWLEYSYTNPNGCSNTEIQQVTILETPVINSITIDGLACDGFPVKIDANVTGSNLEWDWDFGDGSTSADATTAINTYPTFGNYTLTLTVRNTVTNCQDMRSIIVPVGAYPIADFSFLGSCDGKATQFTDESNVSLPDNIILWEWDFGDGTTISGSSATDINPTHSYNFKGTYSVTLRVTTNKGCQQVITKDVNIFPSITILPELPYEQSFNAGNGDWIPGGLNSSWEYGTPDKTIISNATSDGSLWITGRGANNYNGLENSWVESPCFNIASLQKPRMSMDIFYSTDEGADGAVIQYTVDDGVTWEVLGTVDQGIDWYNTVGVLGNPGGQNAGQLNWQGSPLGWSGEGTTWQEANYSLDEVLLAVRDRGDGSGVVRFRINFGSNSDNPSGETLDGFAFDNVFIGERNRIVLFENFMNLDNPVAVTEAATLRNGVAGLDGAIILNYHTNIPQADALNPDNTADPSARTLYYGVSSLPRTAIDGYIEDRTTSEWSDTYYSTRSLVESPFNIDITFPENAEGLLEIKADITAELSMDSTLIVNIVVIEKEINQGNTIAYNVVKKMLPDATGTRVTGEWAAGTIKSFTQTWQANNIYDFDQMAVVVFIQGVYDGQIHQSAIVSPPTNRRYSTQTITALESPEADNMLILYPNPANDILNIDLPQQIASESSTLEVLDLQGKIILTQNIESRQSISINTQNLAEGTYVLRIKSKSETYFSKFVIIH